jgi:hypothetical protein
LAAELSVPGLVLDPSNVKWEKLQEEMASAQNIARCKRLCQIFEAGWVGKQKGLSQVSWEHGWIDLLHLDEYAIIKKDDAGAVDEELSLHCIRE